MTCPNRRKNLLRAVEAVRRPLFSESGIYCPSCVVPNSLKKALARTAKLQTMRETHLCIRGKRNKKE
jgi:hypothetical protein